MTWRSATPHFLALTVALAALPVRAQQAQAPPTRATSPTTRTSATSLVVAPSEDGITVDTTIPFAANGVVDLSLISGEIMVTGWSRSEAHIHVMSEEMPIRFEHGPNRILLDTQRGGHRRHSDGDVQYNLTVPVGTRVLMHSTSGDLRSEGTHGELEARSVSGDVEIDDVVRSATLESVSGNVKARGIDGDVRARSVSGDVDLDRVHGDVTLSSVSGHGYVTEAQSRAVHMETVSGDLTYAGRFDPSGNYDFRAHSGNVRLELPADVNATLSVDTFSGDIRTDFPLTIEPNQDSDRGPTRHHVDTTLGKGGSHVTISTFSGDVEILRAGRRPSSE